MGDIFVRLRLIFVVSLGVNQFFLLNQVVIAYVCVHAVQSFPNTGLECDYTYIHILTLPYISDRLFYMHLIKFTITINNVTLSRFLYFSCK